MRTGLPAQAAGPLTGAGIDPEALDGIVILAGDKQKAPREKWRKRGARRPHGA
jgi:hypothetical protein